MAHRPNDPEERPASKRQRGAMAAFAFASRSLQQISTFAVTLLAARFLMPAEYGVYSIAIIFVMLIQTMTYTGFYHFVVTSKDDERTVLGTSFWMITGMAAAASAVLALAAQPLSAAFNAPDLMAVLLWLALVQPVAGATAWYEAVLMRERRLNLHFSIMFTTNLIALIGGVLFLWLWQSIFALVAFRYLRILSATLLYAVFSRRAPPLVFDNTLAGQALKYSSGLYGARGLNFAARYAADLLLGLMFTTAEAGLYRFGNRLAGGAIDVVTQPMSSFALTQFGAAGRANKSLDRPLERFVGSVMILTGGVAAVIIVFAETMIGTFFNPSYIGALAVTYAMAVRAVFNIGTLVLEPALATHNRTGIVMMFNLIAAGAALAAVFACAPFGLAVLAWGQAGVGMAATFAALIVLNRVAGIKVAGAARALVIALGIIAVYGVVLSGAWQMIDGWMTSKSLALALGLGVATLLAAVVLVIATKLRVFSLSVFSG